MLALFKKIIPQLFISIILDDTKSVLRACIYRGDKLIKSNEKSFQKDDDLLKYTKDLSKNFPFYYTCLLLNAKEQGLIPSANVNDFEKFNVGKMSLQHIKLSNALVYSATEHIEYYTELFENFKGLDFLYSPFALLYYLSQKNTDDKISLYALKYKQILAIIVCKKSEILYGDLKIFEDELGIELSKNDEFNLDLNLEELEAKLDNPELENTQASAVEVPTDNDLQDNKENLENELNIDELNQFSNDLDSCRYIVSSIEKFYNDEKYSGTFINEISLFTQDELNANAVEFLENETFLDVKNKQINILELMIELSRKELE